MCDVAEKPILEAPKKGGEVWLEVVPVYGNQYSPIPTSVDVYAQGAVNEVCTVYNDPNGGYAHC